MSAAITVLHVDDEPDFASVVATYLEDEDERLEVITADDAEAGLAVLDGRAVDCIVSDFEMPGRDGIAFLQTVRERYPDLPFILYTGRGSEEIASDAISAGVTDYLQKERGTGQYPVLANRIANAVETHRSKLAVERTERKLSELAERSRDVLFMFDRDWREVLFVNSAFEDIWGVPVETVLEEPQSFLEGIHSADRLAVEDAMDRLSEGHPQTIEYRVVRPDDTQRWVRADSVPITDDAGEVVRIVGYVRDVTDRKRRELELDSIIENLPGFVYRHRNERRYPLEFVKGQAAAITGYTPSELVEDVRDAVELIHPADRDRVRESGREQLATQGTYDLTYRILRQDGGERWVRDQGTRVEDPVTGEDCLDGFITDITERKARERALADVKQRFQAFVEHASDLITVVDAEGIVQYQSPAVETVLGFPQDALPGHSAFAVIHPDDREAARTAFEGLLERPEEATDVIEYRVRNADGDWVWLESVASNRSRPSVEGYVVTSREITDRKERMRELQRQRNRFEAVFETVPEPVVHVVIEDGEPVIKHVNAAFERVFGVDAETARGRSVDELIVPADARPEAEAITRHVSETGIHQAVITRQAADGERTFLFTAQTMDLGEGDDSHMEGVATYVDLTDQKRREEELERQNERLDEFASVVSHDLRNPLNLAEGRLGLLAEDTDSDHVEGVRAAHERMKALIDDLLTMARSGDVVTEREPLDLAPLVAASWRTIDTHAATLSVETDLTIEADETRLKQLFENLLRNAVEHGGEDVTVTVGALEDGFFVADDGPGIPTDDREAVFEAGYSRQADSTGFGLSIVKEIVEAHDWEIRAPEGTDGGARFEITGVDSARR